MSNHKSKHATSANGEWDWGAWSPCSTTCGTGTRTRTANCKGPFYAGMPCSGTGTQTGNCSGELMLLYLFFLNLLSNVALSLANLSHCQAHCDIFICR